MPATVPRQNTRGGRRDQGRARSSVTYGAMRDDVRGASVAGNDAPLSAERAAACGRTATEGGDTRAGVRRALSFEDQPNEPGRLPRSTPERPRRTTRPGTRPRIGTPGPSASPANRKIAHYSASLTGRDRVSLAAGTAVARPGPTVRQPIPPLASPLSGFRRTGGSHGAGPQ
jgi:hypothetical protein